MPSRSLCAFAGLLALAALPPPPASAVPRFVVDLDEEPEERWKAVILHYKEMGVLEALTRPDPAAPHTTPELEQAWLQVVASQLDEDYSREIDGWVKYAGDANVTRDKMMIGLAQYEMNYPTYCSGIVAAMPNGTVIHGRNMDYELQIQVGGKWLGWPELTVDVTFLREGQPLMTSVTWPGQLGIHTAMRFDKGWTFEQNTRRLGDDFKDNLAAAKSGGRIFTLLARRVMERVPDFKTAVEKLWTANLAAPMYFVMTGSGLYEAAVLTMDRNGVHEVSSPPLLQLDQEGDTWNLLQTNDDFHGRPNDLRRFLETRRLSSATQDQVSLPWVFSEMRDSPLNDHGKTVFTWIAVPATGYHQTVLPTEDFKNPSAVDPASSSFLKPRQPYS